jgi:hypothetical protein
VAINTLLSLLLVYLPGPVPFGLSLAVYCLSALAPGVVHVLGAQTKPELDTAAPDARPGRKRERALMLMGLAVLVVSLRFINLGYSEFQGDEGVIMLRAAAAIEGDEEQLFLHQKGPAEILIPLSTWRLSKEINELWARVPFAWIGSLGIAGVVALGRRWSGQQAAWIAGAILAISGLHVAFSRIVQNQGFVVLMGVAGLIALEDYRRHGEKVDLALGAALMSTSVLGHYDAVLMFPAGLVLALRPMSGHDWRARLWSNWHHYFWGLLVAVLVLSLFYVPFLRHPNFAKTLGYLTRDRMQTGERLYLNVEKIWGVSTVYNSAYYYIALLSLALGSLLALGKQPLAWLAWPMFAVPFGFYLVIVSDPRTHIYTFYAGASLLAGSTVSALYASARTMTRRALVATGILLYAVCAAYPWIVYVDHSPEYVRTFPDNRSALYWTSYDDIFAQGLFGFPYRAGWHAVGALYAQGEIKGFYASNEEQEITDWYTRQSPRSHCPMPDVYIVAENVQDPIYVDRDEIARDYELAGTVITNGQERIHWYERRQERESQRSEPLVEQEAALRQWWTPAQVLPRAGTWSHDAGITLGEKIELEGYDLWQDDATPGGYVRVRLHWRPLVPLQRNYQVFVHLYDGQRLWAQHDGAPECTINATTRWDPGQYIPDEHIVALPDDVPTGRMPVVVGMYDLLTLERLSVPGSVDNAIHLTDVEIHEHRD